jgi:hypothetical protein
LARRRRLVRRVTLRLLAGILLLRPRFICGLILIACVLYEAMASLLGHTSVLCRIGRSAASGPPDEMGILLAAVAPLRIGVATVTFSHRSTPFYSTKSRASSRFPVSLPRFQ